MILLNLCFWLLATNFAVVQAQSSDHEVLASYEKSGTCMSFVPNAGESSKERDAGVSPCKTWCPVHEGPDKAIAACTAPGVTDYSQLPKFTNDHGHKYIPGRCGCTSPESIMPFVDVVAQGLSQLDNILCAVGMSTFQSIAEMALDAIPGGAEVHASVNAAVTVAKTFAENGLESDPFQKFIEKTCKISNWNFDFPVTFGKLKSAPKQRGTSKGCMKKNKGECKSVDDGKSDKSKPHTTKKGSHPTTTKAKSTLHTTTKPGHTTTHAGHTTTHPGHTTTHPGHTTTHPGHTTTKPEPTTTRTPDDDDDGDDGGDDGGDDDGGDGGGDDGGDDGGDAGGDGSDDGGDADGDAGGEDGGDAGGDDGGDAGGDDGGDDGGEDGGDGEDC